ncbi:calcineurin-like phosphoesterase C-terminal domain-containing protein [Robertkochia solimangrovi]|uniref:calcineurin-like phosphoesterase C-terminal domain-containing protein n=1 Tax=Robertkochia solimangrovi TaxID=2213046 RepID=UPI00117D604D|nr:calcineurin-like phosphoesterase family protein [Robertkochia solimangrovi]TRZ45712.1 metallophosphoesterase [Robertkochia solimangrovi]
MDQKRREFIKIGGLTTLAGFSGIGFAFSSCSKETVIDENNKLKITKVSIPSSMDVYAGGALVINGQGFENGDVLQLDLLTDASKKFSTSTVSVDAGSVTFSVPEELTTGTYQLTILRGEERLVLGSLLLNLVANLNIPDREGMTVKGVVYSDGVGIPGVVVSDGFEVTVTDGEGRYYLPSEKKTGFIFISLPGNYEVAAVGNAPQYFKRLSNNKDAVEQKDFSLIKTDNDDHVVISMADWHLANRNNDLDQFTNKVLPDVNTTIDKYIAEGKKTYVLTLGDMTWDLYWYSNNFGLNDYIPYMNQLNTQVFNLMGNHDNDPYKQGDWEAENAYRDVLGPTYYSFNLGQVHYVVLDDVEYLNSGGAEGTVGNRNYNERISNDQIEWLKKDLATVTDKSTPVVVAMHTPLYKNPTLDESGNQVDQLDLANGGTLVDCLKEFTNVHVLSGHTHINYTVEKEANIMEHNTAAICATWWWTGRNGYAGNHICKDGSPGGYGIWQIKGRDLQWHYKGIGYQDDYQFRTYDMNNVHITAAAFAPNASEEAMAAFSGRYSSQNANNEVLLNVWGYDPHWKIEVSENGNPLEVKRIRDKDPLHIISYEAFRLNAGANPTGAFITGETAHLFSVNAVAPDTTLSVKVTDRFGNVFTEEMARPKAFSLDMK